MKAKMHRAKFRDFEKIYPRADFVAKLQRLSQLLPLIRGQ